MKALDWDHNEFSFDSCIQEFKVCSPTVYDVMIKTLAWQWEADSIAAYNLLPIIAPFVSSSELWAAYTRVGDSEVTHSLTYSEIVKGSFENPHSVMADILAEVKALQRLETIATVFEHTYQVSHRVALGVISRESYSAYDAVFIFVVTLLALERIQFMASFAITFAVADSGMFLPIGKAVQKIATDEITVHVPLGKAVITNELSTKQGKASFERNAMLIRRIVKDITQLELNQVDYILPEGKELIGLNNQSLKDWVLFGTTNVCDFLTIPSEYKRVNKNPLGYMADWIDINGSQGSPQEQQLGNYLLGGLKNNTIGKVYEIDF
jgi:ribonucleoside-diphosphate reductase beta chain